MSGLMDKAKNAMGKGGSSSGGAGGESSAEKFGDKQLNTRKQYFSAC